MLAASLVTWSAAQADDSITGVCPDGSFFVVSSRAAAPCKDPKFVPASELPPIRPEYLPRPYTWYVDQEEQDPNNPYNLVDKAQQIRSLRRQNARSSRESSDEAPSLRSSSRSSNRESEVARTGAVGEVEPQGQLPESQLLSLAPDELRDLVELLSLRQQLAPATIAVEDVRGAPQLSLQFAYSPALEQTVRSALTELGAKPESKVVVFAVRTDVDSEFYPRFFVAQAGRTFQPLAERVSEQGWLLGREGPMAAGLLSLGYLVLPEPFQLESPMTLWWNDRRVEAVLDPAEQD